MVHMTRINIYKGYKGYTVDNLKSPQNNSLYCSIVLYYSRPLLHC